MINPLCLRFQTLGEDDLANNCMENKLLEDKEDTGGSLTVLKEYLLEKKNFPFAKTS